MLASCRPGKSIWGKPACSVHYGLMCLVLRQREILPRSCYISVYTCKKNICTHLEIILPLLTDNFAKFTFWPPEEKNGKEERYKNIVRAGVGFIFSICFSVMCARACVWCMCPCVHACVQRTDKRQPVLSFLRETPHFSFETQSLTGYRLAGHWVQTTRNTCTTHHAWL